MSTVQRTSGPGRKFSMSQPAKAPETKVPEPSIDEILASIRRSIVPDDDAGKDAGKPAARKSGSRKTASTQPASTQTASSQHAGARGRLAAGELAEAAGASDGAAPAAMDGEYRSGDVDPGSDENGGPGGPADAAVVKAGEAPAAGRPASESQLLSPHATAAVDVAFDSLAHTVLSQNPRTLEDLVREMLKPMLKAWLDANLPDMVERLVRAEIERVSRRGERR